MTERRLDIIFAAISVALLGVILFVLFTTYQAPKVVHQTVRETGISLELFAQLVTIEARIATLEAAIRPSIAAQEERYLGLAARLDAMAESIKAPDYSQILANKAQLDVLIAAQGD